jgi:eukaryotic-like serine/threonine-protein kinase
VLGFVAPMPRPTMARPARTRGILIPTMRAPDLAGRALDERYELHAVIGEGAFGRVYRGLDRRLARTVAVKVIKPWWAEDSEWVERFEREAQLLARISDPGIVQIFDIGHAEEGPYYVAELVEGESLAERLRLGPLPAAEARGIAEQLCDALASAHAQGVVHCDVKPANVLLSTDGVVKVGDFGVARLAEGTSQALTATVAGTPRYMSPEQARGRATTSATDVYSAGVVLYEMLAGEPPFMHGSPVELGLRHLQDEPPPLPAGVPRTLREVVERALAKDPAERFPDGAAMAAALRAAEAAPSAAAADDRAASGQTANGASSAAVADDDDGSPRQATDQAASETAATIDLAGAETLDASAARTKLLPRGGSLPPSRPAGRRSRRQGSRRLLIAALVAAVAIAAAILAVVVIGGGSVSTTVPELRGLPRGGVEARARRLHVKPAFSTRHSDATAAGIAIAQRPSAGTHIAEGSTVQVVLSAGPPPVKVPGVVGESSSSAGTEIADAGLRYGVTLVAAPGSRPGVVTHQSPAATVSVPHGSTVALSVAEAPRWRALTSFSGVDDGRSVPFRILGSRWRVRYSMDYQGTCTLLLVCFGPSAEADNLQSDSRFGGFELGEGSSQTHTFDSGPGLYRVVVSGGHDSARWSMTVEDYY